MDPVMLAAIMIGYMLFRLAHWGIDRAYQPAESTPLNQADPHRIKELQIEVYGQEWYDLVGDPCDCKKCNPPVPPKGPGVVSSSKFIPTPMPPAPEPIYTIINGIRFPRPSHIPEYASAELWEDGAYTLCVYRYKDRKADVRQGHGTARICLPASWH